jgi:hypothetical protein
MVTHSLLFGTHGLEHPTHTKENKNLEGIAYGIDLYGAGIFGADFDSHPTGGMADIDTPHRDWICRGHPDDPTLVDITRRSKVYPVAVRQ